MGISHPQWVLQRLKFNHIEQWKPCIFHKARAYVVSSSRKKLLHYFKKGRKLSILKNQFIKRSGQHLNLKDNNLFENDSWQMKLTIITIYCITGIDPYLYTNNGKQNKIIGRQIPLIQTLFIYWNLLQLIWSICNGNTTQTSCSHVTNSCLEIILERI